MVAGNTQQKLLLQNIERYAQNILKCTSNVVFHCENGYPDLIVSTQNNIFSNILTVVF